MSGERLSGWPAFAREVDATLAVHSQYVLWGNLRDSLLVQDPGTEACRLLGLHSLLWELLRGSGYQFILVYDPVDGPTVYPPDESAEEAATGLLGDRLRRRSGGVPLHDLRGILEAVARPQVPVRAGVLLDYASQLVRDPGNLEAAERDFFLACRKLSYTAVPVRADHKRATPLHNPVVWLVDREGDLPLWLTAGNDMVRSISLPLPDYGARQETALLLARSLGVTDVDTPGHCEAFAEQCEGLTLQAMIEVTRLARDRGVDFAGLPDAVRTYKLGVLDSPWRRAYLRDRVVAGESAVAGRVVGQPQAITKTLDILKRAVLGLSAAQASRDSTRPRGVLFFAGPTGVGKTELAKAISSLVFGDERAYLRFDMSEFSSEHAGDRLIGAPPGYVGFESGGELTNAVRQQPFRVILFDEIEKAHPRILDKFLQILDDGRLTDGRGTTAYFSEAVLVFTSNLGMVVDDEVGRARRNVDPSMDYEEIEARIKVAISHHFNQVLNRPELLNRFGDNIVVFNFIGPDAAQQIFAALVSNIAQRLMEEQRIRLELEASVTGALRAWCTADLSTGGRGIGNALESYFVNPLARALFARTPERGVVRVTEIRREADVVSLELA